MVLTAANLFHYLLDRGFASAESVVDGEFRVSDLSRRNRAFQVSLGKNRGYLVKQVKEWRESNLNTFEAEAGWYGLACNDSNFARLTGFLSKCCAYDEDHEILILEVPPESEDLDRFHRRIGWFPTETAHLVGETLGAFHTALPDSAREQLRPSFHEETPWVLSLHERAAESFESLSPANSELLRIVQKYPGFGEALDNLRETWPRDTLINGT